MPRKHFKIATAYHRSTLNECLDTECPITYRTAKMLLKMGIYKFYAYDDRIKANRYLLYEIDGNSGMPTWLHIYVD